MPTHPSSPFPAPAPPATPTTTLQLGKIKVIAAAAATANPPGKLSSKRQPKPSLTVSSTLLLGLPPQQQSGGWKTATELCEASKRGEIFIAKAGSCEIGLETRVDGVLFGGGGEGVEFDGRGGVGEVMALAGACAVCFLPLLLNRGFGVVLMVGEATGVGRCWAGVEGEAWCGGGGGREGVVLFASQGFGVGDGQGGVGEGAGCGV